MDIDRYHKIDKQQRFTKQSKGNYIPYFVVTIRNITRKK